MEKKEIYKKHKSIENDKMNGNCFKNINQNNSNEQRNYIGIDDNFNLTFGRSSNKIEIFISNNNKNNNIKKSIKNTKSKKNNNLINGNIKYNINNFKNNIKIINNKKSKNNNIEIDPQSQRNSDPPIMISEKIFKEGEKKNITNSNKEEGTPSFKFLNGSNKKERINRNTAYQFKTRKINLPKNPINIENIKLNNHILLNILKNKKNLLMNHNNNINDFNS